MEKQDDTFYSIVTYLDNPFLAKSQIEEIEKLKDRDQNLWRVFGLGQKGQPTRLVFTHQKIYDDLPIGAKLLGYSIDFGYEDPCTLLQTYKLNDSLYCKELIYMRNITIPDFIYKIKDLNLNLYDDFICDSANPQAITELSRAGINAKPVKKDSILSGIDQVKRHNLFVHKDSINLLNELNSYVWKQDKNGKNVDEPEDRNNHLLDPLRYILQMKLMRNTGVYVY
jgi:phage terminase large subunit